MTIFLGIMIALCWAGLTWEHWKSNTEVKLVSHGGRHHGKGDVRYKRQLLPEAHERLKAVRNLLFVWGTFEIINILWQLPRANPNWALVREQTFSHAAVLFGAYFVVVRPLVLRLVEAKKNAKSVSLEP